MEIRDVLSTVLLLAAVPFFLAGTLGLLRFPDVFCRLHALTKADNLGLGLIVLGLMLQAPSWHAAAGLLLTWLLVLLAGATVAHLIARKALADGQRPWSRS
ncbi:monovalent cation/H(+) antiporter subunit G [Geoalkalibacter halelectricus]|uniref:Monovalent cation/H(+) antiporter subunit G n=1 Tax=Geoalkalibacter halelectricus TaxID=2847045 RepID=A0ABY5ZJD0_9BACT|nr:monovalent cation/H(+) antiporter subunit G [Geoalkalibacter halelectricus]MDO3377944.1 monovalent cation/H(+) antiporter subunit G [Geoalkalibacter halelectricus]UWZ77875.1 monovalent cation/H(+) antiporter subunit G [Geoalkalibacter halelectricus]